MKKLEMLRRKLMILTMIGVHNAEIVNIKVFVVCLFGLRAGIPCKYFEISHPLQILSTAVPFVLRCVISLICSSHLFSSIQIYILELSSRLKEVQMLNKDFP